MMGGEVMGMEEELVEKKEEVEVVEEADVGADKGGCVVLEREKEEEEEEERVDVEEE